MYSFLFPFDFPFKNAFISPLVLLLASSILSFCCSYLPTLLLFSAHVPLPSPPCPFCPLSPPTCTHTCTHYLFSTLMSFPSISSPPSTEPSDGDLHGCLPPLPAEYSGGHPLSASHLDCRHCRHLGVPGYCRLVLLLCEYSTLMTYMTRPFFFFFFTPIMLCPSQP